MVFTKIVMPHHNSWSLGVQELFCNNHTAQEVPTLPTMANVFVVFQNEHVAQNTEGTIC